jgi:hypothetical protein
MSIESKLQQINSELQKFQTSVERIFERLVSRLETPEVQEKIQHFKEIEISKISRKILQTKEVIDSPIHVGLLGRYSHGKTALINKFFSIGQEYSLPEGSGIVTSKITVVEFDSEVSRPVCLQVCRDNTENVVSIEALKASVAGQAVDENTEIIDYYRIKLPARESFSELFAKKRINLLDMPGLGGLYFRDNEKTRKYMGYVDMLLVIIKITEIKEASKYIEPYINNLSIPIIPVLTFFDAWQNDATFTACVSEEEAIFKAKELIKDQIPSLSKHEIRTIAVSSSTGLNISALRECVLNFVETQNFAVRKVQPETPEVFRRRVGEISKELNKIAIDAENSLSKLQREVQGLMPKSQTRFESFEQAFKRKKDKLTSDSKKKISQCVKEIFSDFKNIGQDITYLNDFNEIRERISRLEQEINSTKITELNIEISDLVVNFKTNLSDAVVNYIDGLDIDELRRQELRQSTFDLIESSQSSIDNPVEYRSPPILGEIIQEITKASVDVVLDNLTNPEVILPLLSVPIILWLKSLRVIGGIIAPFLDPIIIIIAIAFVWRVISSDRTKRLNEAKRKIVERLLASFDKQKIINDSYQSFVETIDEITDAVQEELQDVTDPYSKDVRRIADGVKDFQIEVKTINKFLQNQIAVIESEQV